MAFIEEFVAKALAEEGSFLMKKGNRYISFFQDKVGAARYIFARYNYMCDDIVGLAQLCLEPKIVAIVAYNLVYIVDKYFFDVFSAACDVPMINQMVFFDQICQNANEQIEDEIFPVLFDRLSVDEITDEDELVRCRFEARKSLLNGTAFTFEKCDIELSGNQVAQVLCKFTTVGELARKIFSEKESAYKHRKAFMQTVKKFMQSPDVAEDWERRLAEGVNSVNAKTLTVEFAMNGKTESAKIEPVEVLDHLIKRDYFCDFDFVVAKRGQELLENLDAATSRGDDTGRQLLTCEHITKITYGRDVLFEKEN